MLLINGSKEPGLGSYLTFSRSKAYGWVQFYPTFAYPLSDFDQWLNFTQAPADWAGVISTGPPQFAGDRSVFHDQVSGIVTGVINSPPVDGVNYIDWRLSRTEWEYSGWWRKLLSEHVSGEFLYPGCRMSCTWDNSRNYKKYNSTWSWLYEQTYYTQLVSIGDDFMPILVTFDIERTFQEINGGSSGTRVQTTCYFPQRGVMTSGVLSSWSLGTRYFAEDDDLATVISQLIELCKIHFLHPELMAVSLRPCRKSELVGKIPGVIYRDVSRSVEQQLVEGLRHFCSRYYSRFYRIPQPNELWGDLCQLAIDNCKYVQINSVAYLLDLKETLSELKAIKSVYRNPTNVKAWASLYLNVKYGTRLTVADTMEIIGAIKRQSHRKELSRAFSTCRSRGQLQITSEDGNIFSPTADMKAHYKVYHSPYDSKLLQSIKFFMDCDLWLSMKNTWDLIPYSFVINWIVNLEDFFSAFDANIYSEYLEVFKVTKSIKASIDLTTYLNNYPLYQNKLEFTGLTFTRYDRSISDYLNLPVPTIDGVSTEWSNHLAELAAIIIQHC